MKKIILFTFLTIAFLQANFAQTNEEWQNQMQQLQRRMQDMTEQLSKQFGGNSFFLDTTFVQPFDFRSLDGGMPFDSNFVKRFEFRHFDDGNNFSFDTSIVRQFYWDNQSDTPMNIDTFFFKEYKNVEPGNTPDSFFKEDFSKYFGDMIHQMEQYFEQFGQQLDPNAPLPAPKGWRSKPEEDAAKKLKPTPAPQKKRKTTAI